MFCAKCGKLLPAGATFCPSCGTPVQGAGSTGFPNPTVSGFDTLTKDSAAQQYWVERLIAFVVDAVIFYVILAVVVFFVALPFFVTGFGAAFAFFFGGYAFLGGLIFVFYFAVTESSSGASIGKRIFRLKVVSKTGSTPNFGEAFVRNISKIYWLLLLLDVIVGLAVSKEYTQKFSDHYMGTSVTRS